MDLYIHYTELPQGKELADIVGEPLDIHHLYKNKKERDEKIAELLTLVGLNSDHARRYAHEFSGGQRQRIGIARALAVNPKLIVCDEPVSALDVSIQAQILNLLMDLQDQMGLTYMFITHDLSVVKHISDEIAVLYVGQCIEKAPSRELFKNPLHPYTVGLQKSKPVVKRKVDRLYNIPGQVPNPIDMPNYCYFKERCDRCTAKCEGDYPHFIQVSPTHRVSCYLYYDEEGGETNA